jgi:SNF2 family DNA or RNA helicase
MIVNKFASYCSICNIRINSGDGFVFKKGEKWTPVCDGYQCVKRACPDEISSYRAHMARLQKEFEEDDPFDEEAVKRAKDKKLYDFQIEGVKWLTQRDHHKETPNCLIGDEPGLGKTATVLLAHNMEYGLLAVVPPHLKINWRDEAQKWRPELKVTILKDGKTFKYPEPGELVITTYGLLPWWLERASRKRKNPMITEEEKEAAKKVVLVFDEIQALKDKKTKKSIKARQLRELAHKTIGLTGTPIENHEFDIYNICTILGIEKLIFGNFMNFVRLFGGTKGKYGWKFSKQVHKSTPTILRAGMLRRTKKEVDIQLPTKIYKSIVFDTPTEIKETLDNVWDLFRSSKYFEDDQLPPIGMMSIEKKSLAESKIPVLKNLVESFEEQDIPVLVFSAHPKVVESIGKRKGWKYIHGGTEFTPEKKAKISKEFQDGKLKGLALSIKAAGTGLTLTRAHHVIFNDLDWNPANNVQAQDRVARIGQEQSKAIYYHIVSDHPIDRHIHRLLLEKMYVAQSALDAPVAPKKNFAESAHESEEDFEERIKRVGDEEREMRKEAILSRLPLWLSQEVDGQSLSFIGDERAYEMMQEIGTLIKISGVAVRRQGKETHLGAMPHDLRILRLLRISGLESQEERFLAEKLLERYADKRRQAFVSEGKSV